MFSVYSFQVVIFFPERICVCVRVCVLSHFSYVWLFVTLWIVAHQAPLSMGVLQARILEWVAISFTKESSRAGDQNRAFNISCTGMQVLYHRA